MADMKINLMTLNLRFGLADDGPNAWDYRKKALPTLFRTHPADIIAFQEVNDFQCDYLQKILVDYHYIGFRHPAPSFWQNNLIFFRHPWHCIADDHFYLSPTPDIPSRMPQSRWPRQGTIGVFKALEDDYIIACANTHFDFDPEVQTTSAKIVLERLSAIAAGYPTVLMGDFNAHPDSPCHQVFTAATHQLGTAADPFRNVWEAPFPGTFHNFSGQSDQRHIDWILYRGPLHVKSRQVIQAAFENRFPSDHFPVHVAFGFGATD